MVPVISFDIAVIAWITCIVSIRVIRVAPDGSQEIVIEERGHIFNYELGTPAVVAGVTLPGLGLIGLILAGALISIATNPLWFSMVAPIEKWLHGMGFENAVFDCAVGAPGIAAALAEHVRTTTDQRRLRKLMDANGVDLGDLSLTRDVGANLLAPGQQTVSSADGGVTWTLAGLAGLTDLLRVEEELRRTQSDHWNAVYRLRLGHAAPRRSPAPRR